MYSLLYPVLFLCQMRGRQFACRSAMFVLTNSSLFLICLVPFFFFNLIFVSSYFACSGAVPPIFVCSIACDGNPDSQGLACDTESEDDRFCCSWSSSEQCYRKCCTSCTHGWSGASGACYNWSWWATFLIVVGSIFGLFVGKDIYIPVHPCIPLSLSLP